MPTAEFSSGELTGVTFEEYVPPLGMAFWHPEHMFPVFKIHFYVNFELKNFYIKSLHTYILTFYMFLDQRYLHVQLYLLKPQSSQR